MTEMSAEVRAAELHVLEQQALGCTRCRLAESRTQVVFGAGAPDADVMIIGEGPGRREDEQGLPFVGPSGRLLEQLLGEIGLERSRGLHRQRGQVSSSEQPRPATGRDRRVQGLSACPADPGGPQGCRHPRQLLIEAPAPNRDGDHPAARPRLPVVGSASGAHVSSSRGAAGKCQSPRRDALRLRLGRRCGRRRIAAPEPTPTRVDADVESAADAPPDPEQMGLFS